MSKKNRPRPTVPAERPRNSAERPKNIAAPQKNKATPSAEVSKPADKSRLWLWAAIVITALVYIPSLSSQLVNWDDPNNIYENPNLEVINGESIKNIFDLKKGNIIGNYNPLPILTFAIEKKLAGDFNPKLIHTTNLVLHLATVFFVFRLLMQLGLGMMGSFIGALLFGIHPMRVESVAWATERKDVLFAVFFFAALTLYMKWIQTQDKSGRFRLYLVMIALAVLSLFSKVQAVTLPLSMLAIDYFMRRPLKLNLIWEKTPFWILSLAFGLINIYTLQQQGSINQDTVNFTSIDRLCIGAYSFCVYLYKLAVPYPMLPLYPYPKPLPTEIYLSPIVFLAFWYLVYRLWKQEKRMLVFGIVFFFFNVVFLLQILGAGQGFLADRFTYVPYFGFFAIAGYYWEFFANKSQTRTASQVIAALFFVMCAFVSVKQIGIWKNGETLWSHVIKFEKDKSKNSLPYWNRGQYLRNQKKFEQSLKDYSQAITISPNDAELYNSRAKTYFDMSSMPEFASKAAQYLKLAMEDYSKALGMANVKEKTRSEMLANRGAAFGMQNRWDEALKDLNESLSLNPDNKNAYFNRSILYFQLRQFDKAIEDYSTYLKYDPNNSNIWYERGMLRRSLSKSDDGTRFDSKMAQDAVTDLSQAIKLNPNFGLAYIERARAYRLLGNSTASNADYQRADQLGVKKSAIDQ